MAIGLGNGVQDQPLANQPPVHEEINIVPVELLNLGPRDESHHFRRERLRWRRPRFVRLNDGHSSFDGRELDHFLE